MAVTDDRAGMTALRERLRQLEQTEVRVGVLQPEPTKDGESTITVVAVANEYGTRTIPQRSFIGRTLDEQQGAIAKTQAQAFEAVVFDEVAPAKAAGAVGAAVASMVRDTIRSNVPPALAPATVEAKGHARSLIDSGQLLRSIQHEVVQGGGDGA